MSPLPLGKGEGEGGTNPDRVRLIEVGLAGKKWKKFMNANMTRWVAMALGMGLLLFAGTAAAQRQLAGTRSPPELVANPAQAQAAFEQYQKLSLIHI